MGVKKWRILKGKSKKKAKEKGKDDVKVVLSLFTLESNKSKELQYNSFDFDFSLTRYVLRHCPMPRWIVESVPYLLLLTISRKGIEKLRNYSSASPSKVIVVVMVIIIMMMMMMIGLDVMNDRGLSGWMKKRN